MAAKERKAQKVQKKKHWKDLSVLVKFLIILGVIALTIFLFIPGLFTALAILIPGYETSANLFHTIENGLQIIVGIASLILAIVSMVFANTQDKKITASLEKLYELERKIDMADGRESCEQKAVKSDSPKEK